MRYIDLLYRYRESPEISEGFFLVGIRLNHPAVIRLSSPNVDEKASSVVATDDAATIN